MTDSRIPPPSVSALLLAAGTSQRFGGDKRLARVSGESTLLYQSLKPYLALELDPVVALAKGPDDDPVEAMLTALGVRSLRCSRSAEGMGSTLGEAVARLVLRDALIVGLGDMPLLRASTLQKILEHASTQRIVYPVYGKRRGNPVLFGRDFHAALATIRGERGAAGLIRSSRSACHAVEVTDPGVVVDVDTPLDLRALD